ncbi:MAG: hypothetical protein Fur0010_17660 [Bdellovibrio sp.]
MTSIELNGRKLNNSFAVNATINNVIDEIYNSMLETNHVLTECILDGTPYEVGQPLEIFSETASTFGNIKFISKSNAELGLEAIESCPAYIDNMCEKIGHLINAYQGADKGANELFGDLVDTLDLYIQLMSQVFQIIKSCTPKGFQKGDDIQKLEIHLLSVLKAMLPAKEKEDIIMLTDLLEYELVDNLTQWKIKIIPSLRTQLQSLISRNSPGLSAD